MLPLLLALAVVQGCGDEAVTAETERMIRGNTVVKTLERAMREAGTGQARSFDGSFAYSWDFDEPGRLLLTNNNSGWNTA